MKKQLSFGLLAILLMSTLAACGGNTTSSTPSSRPNKTSKEPTVTSRAPAKTVSNLSISLGNDGEKAYITVRGTQSNYSAEEFKWAWGLRTTGGDFHAGKANPTDEDFQPATFNDNNEFTVKYCLTDVTSIAAGELYRIYGGTPETYTEIPFASNMFGATDATRSYYLRQDVDNALTFDNVQPIKYTKASIVEVPQAELPEGVTFPGAYLKVGGANSKGLTLETINAWHEANNIAGDFQRCVGGGYELHVHSDQDRFWKIEGDDVFFYLYVGFISEGEGWMLHFDVVSGNQNAGLHTENVFNGETAYTIDGATYKIYSDTSKGQEENYWGCLGVYREAAQ